MAELCRQFRISSKTGHKVFDRYQECGVQGLTDRSQCAAVRLLKLPDAALNDKAAPYLTTRRWGRERYAEWFNGSPENSPLWQSRVLGEFPSSSSNALIPLVLLEAARRRRCGAGQGPFCGRGLCGGAILDTGIFTDADARGPVLNFIHRFKDRVSVVRVDSSGMGWYMTQHIRDAGYVTVGLNASSAVKEKERFTNQKAQRYWNLRERFQRVEIAGLSDECLAELASISYLIDPKGRTAIEDKESVKSTLGAVSGYGGEPDVGIWVSYRLNLSHTHQHRGTRPGFLTTATRITNNGRMRGGWT
jgi:hypothetical protein